MSDVITLYYYNSNAADFSETTKDVDFSEVQQIFTNHLSPDAFILHLFKEELPNIFHKMHRVLKRNGIIYTSFKHGTFEGKRNGRYFTDFTEEMFVKFARQIPGLKIEKMWIAGDVREGTSVIFLLQPRKQKQEIF